MILYQSAFTGDQPLLKGGLHCHTTRSDGRLTPEEVLRLHKDNHYDFLAITDHRLYNYKNYAPDTGITVLPGMEMDATVTSDEGMCFHSVCIGPPLGDGNGFSQDQSLVSASVRSQYEYQRTLDMLHRANNMTVYCHPEWSCTPARSWENLYGNFAMELWNSGCVQDMELDRDNGYMWDELLVRGHRIWGIATDDGHKKEHHCKGWVRVKAANNVNAILSALKNGDFYSSCGPEIYDFHIEDGMAFVRCSPCRSVQFKFGRRPTPLITDPQGGLIDHAQFAVHAQAAYMRVTLTDAQDCRAWSNPIYLEK